MKTYKKRKAIETIYHKQSELLLRILPLIDSLGVFALKGGTAINFFIRDMPRLSVDIDLTYMRVLEREQSIKEISDSLDIISEKILKHFPGTKVAKKKLADSDNTVKLIINSFGVAVKIEPNTVIRGTVFPPMKMNLSKRVQEVFETDVYVNILSLPDLYDGKICATLDRQHPRDIFDTMLLLENEGFNEQIRKAFIVYLISHPRPILELLNPNLKDISEVYENEFSGMTFEPINIDRLLHFRKNLVSIINQSLTYDEKLFLLSIKSGEPDWGLLDLDNIEELPAVKWKLANIKNMDGKKREIRIEMLKKHLKI